MQRIFDNDQLIRLKQLFETGEYTKTDLARMFHCSVTTVCLWLNPDPKVREDKFRSRATRTHCDCGRLCKGHAKCKICGIQMHSLEEITQLPEYFAYGAQSKCEKLCDICFDKYSKKKLTVRSYHKTGKIFEPYSITLNPYSKEVSI